jgi:hypothetical protein
VAEKKVVAEEDGSQDGEQTEKKEQNGDAKENGVEKEEEEKKESLENGDSKGKFFTYFTSYIYLFLYFFPIYCIFKSNYNYFVCLDVSAVKRKSEVGSGEIDPKVDGASPEKKAKLEEKVENGEAEATA